MNYKQRLQRLRQGLQAARVDAVLVNHLPNIRYLCGFTGSAGILVVTGRENVFFSDGRYSEQARQEVQGAKIRIRSGKSALAATAEWIAEQGTLRRMGIDPAHITVGERDTLARGLRRQRLVSVLPIVEQMRMVKDSEEVKRIRAACHMAAGLVPHLLETIYSGETETRVAGQLECAARMAGAEEMAFPTIIASGPRAALPHGRASSARIPAKGFVVCDFGVILAGYCSDMTRTVHVGRPSAEARGLYEAVQEAQHLALEAVRPGVTVGEVDFAARKLLRDRHLGKYFTHSTGHGLGLEIHESPRIASGQKDVLRPGMVITIEPGIYVPGKWGVRIEDTVVVNETGCEILTPCPKAMIVL